MRWLSISLLGTAGLLLTPIKDYGALSRLSADRPRRGVARQCKGVATHLLEDGVDIRVIQAVDALRGSLEVADIFRAAGPAYRAGT